MHNRAAICSMIMVNWSEEGMALGAPAKSVSLSLNLERVGAFAQKCRTCKVEELWGVEAVT